MKRLLSCEFNMDTACVELKFANGSMIAIDTIAVENEVADNMYQRSELDCQRQFEIVRKRRRNFVVFRRRGGNKNQVLPCSKRVFRICCFWRINSLRSFRR